MARGQHRSGSPETPTDPLERARNAFDEGRWTAAYGFFREADEQSSLGADELEDMALNAYLIGRDSEAVALLARALRQREHGEDPRAARTSFWLGFVAHNRGDHAQAEAWFGRAEQLLPPQPLDLPERVYALLPQAFLTLVRGNAEEAGRLFSAAFDLARRHHDADAEVLACLGRGQSLVAQGDSEAGIPVLDAALATATTAGVSPVIVGLAYCAVISSCRAAFDVDRAREWTDALDHWCKAHPDLSPYRGQCLIHRAEIDQLRGDWSQALDEAQRACRRLERAPDRAAAGAAHYQLAELHRLCGRLEDAEGNYRAAGRWGHDVQPGLALLRLAQGDIAAAVAGLRRVMEVEAEGDVRRIALASAYVEVMLAAGDVTAARRGADELLAAAEGSGSAHLRAIADHASGCVLLAEGRPVEALASLRRALRVWSGSNVPYEAARAQASIATACAELGDHDGAAMAREAAQRTFEELGARGELARVEPTSGSTFGRGLTGREIEVLRLVTRGLTNRQIASELAISEKTVARHLSNIFVKIDVPSRAAATAYAFTHNLV